MIDIIQHEDYQKSKGCRAKAVLMYYTHDSYKLMEQQFLHRILLIIVD